MSQLDQIKMTLSNMEKLLLYREILNDKIIKKIRHIVITVDSSINSDNNVSLYYQVCSDLIRVAEQQSLPGGDLVQNYFLQLIATDENPFSLACEKNRDNISAGLYQAAMYDLKILKDFFTFTLTDIGISVGIGELSFLNDYSTVDKRNLLNPLQRNFKTLKENFSKEKAEKIIGALVTYYNNCGCGDLCKYSSFRWNNELGLVGIQNTANIEFDDLIGYVDQKETLIENTLVFLKGRPANNVLLYGESGTGKSSSVKALINKFAPHGLRLLEISKDQIKLIPEIIDILNRRGLYFIIFMDDLSFEDFETDYKYLKAVMEGGIEEKPDNVLFYATTNRKHIIKERWQDRDDSDIHKSDAQQEKLSLSERFGITITYLSPDQKEYLEIVKSLAEKSKISLSEKELKDQALKWEKWHHGRSGRTARQFIDYLMGKSQSK